MKVIIFGLGKYFKNREAEIRNSLDKDEIVAFTDNAIRSADNIDYQPFYLPGDAIKLDYDKIIVTSQCYYLEIRKQLMDVGVPVDRIVSWEEYRCYGKDEVKVFESHGVGDKECLIITDRLDFNGGSLAAFYAALAIKEIGFRVCLLSKGSNDTFLRMVNHAGIAIWINKGLPFYISPALDFGNFDAVIVNTYQMRNVVFEIAKKRRVIWWLHEFRLRYAEIHAHFPDIEEKGWLDNVSVYAVSKRARNNFLEFYPNASADIWTAGIPDMYHTAHTREKNKEKLTVAIIGGVSALKGQDVLVEAMKIMDEAERERYQIWIIGGYDVNNDYDKKLLEQVKEMSQIKLLGALTKEEVYNLFPSIDVVVCASMEETLSLTIIEGMMFGKICITTKATGIADYMENNKNGFIVPAGDASALKECLRYVEGHREECKRIAKEGRKTYEKYFSMEVFEERTKTVLKSLEDMCV